MRKATIVKLFCLAIACMLLIPMIIACGDNTPELPDNGSTNSGTESSNNGGTNGGTNSGTTTTETVLVNFRGNGKGAEFEGETTVEVTKGGKLGATQIPDVFRDGFEFEYWAYDKNGDNEWQSSDIFKEDTVLYAVWTEDAGNTGNSSNTGDSSNTGNSSNTENSGSTTDSSNPPVNPPVDNNKVTIEFNTGAGYFEDASLYEVEVDKGGRLSTLPTPIHENPAMSFEGWYKDANFTIAVSRSDKYEDDTVLYAYWTEQAECTDGSFDHLYTTWEADTQPDCTRAGTVARYCQYCNAKQTKPGDPAKGHQFGQWQEAFMARERTCGRLGCGEKEIQNFKDVTLSVLGNTPAEQIEGNSDAFYNVPFTTLINGTWNEGYGHFVGPKGNGAAYVIFTLAEATTLDRIYFKGDGSVSMNIYVQYEGEDDYTFIGLCGGTSEKENTPFKEPDPTKKITKIKFQEDNPAQGTSMWQEVAFVKVATEE